MVQRIEPMTNTVVAHMKTCHKTNKVTVWMKDDGNLGVKIVSDCPHVRDYASKLTEITMDDVVSFAGSKVVDPDIRASLSVPCLTPIAVFEAAWLELGMLSKNLVNQVKDNSVSFHPDIDLEQL
ncbi:MAG: hypothetical protein J5673_06055 [Candidatus Methanomethylophilaceae archaeon]|nr:hypothetical protein [Candidatus Methanomethylophilaceae archaeon]